ncbi:hypothetical protein [Deinococcus ficus]|uniref:Uncharacterized protein n=1 Tax=Deinococcus ficus TaxID=317577 RepID=A0A221T2V5_9DEIO|nr:hypothetical protein [Deinococcus ficus]ASN83257.1 hypothetical protein DFI_18845 [Deinococcus ficus]
MTSPAQTSPLPALTPATLAPTSVQATPATPAAPETSPAQPQRTKGRNPHRRSLPRDNRFRDATGENPNAHIVMNQDPVDISLDARRGESSGPRQTGTITILGVTDKGERQTNSVGICIRDQHNLRFMRYPTRETLDTVLPHVLETALKNAPALSDLILTTPYKQLWSEANYTEETQRFLRQYGCRVKKAYPLPHDLGGTLARLAANGILGPQLVEYHLYTASVTDERRAYVAALLWGKSYAHRFVQTLPAPSLALAEAAATEWAFKLMPRTSTVLISNANPVIGQLWANPKSLQENAEMREAMRGVGRQMKAKDLRFKTDIEKPHHQLARVVREIVGGLYAGADVRRSP